MARSKYFGGFADLFGDIGRARRATSIYTELSTLSDDGLKARGLNRADLPSFAFNKAFGDN